MRTIPRLVCNDLSSHRNHARITPGRVISTYGNHYMPQQKFITVTDIPHLMLAYTEAKLAGNDTFKFKLATGEEVELVTDFAKYVIEAFEMAYRA